MSDLLEHVGRHRQMAHRLDPKGRASLLDFVNAVAKGMNTLAPSTLAPISHTHPESDVVGLVADLASKIEFQAGTQWSDSASTSSVRLAVTIANAILCGDSYGLLARLGISATSTVIGPLAPGSLPAPVSSRILTIADAAAFAAARFNSVGFLEINHKDAASAGNPLATLTNEGTLGTTWEDFLSCVSNGTELLKIDGGGFLSARNIGLIDPSGPFTGAFLYGDISGVTTNLTADRGWYFADVDGDVLIGTLTSSGYTVGLGLSATLRSSTSSSGASFRDTTTATKRLRVVLSGAVGNNALTFSNTAARNYSFGNLSGNVALVGNDPPAVASGALGIVDLTAQSAAIGSTNLSSTPPAGMYLIHYEITCTTGDATAGTIQLDVAATGDGGAQTTSSAALPLTTATLSATNPIRGTMERYLASGDIAYAVPVTGAVNAARFAVRIRVVALG